MMKVGITGGIGSGKTTVCRLFAQRGVAVYDSDAAARRLMCAGGPLAEELVRRFGRDVYRLGTEFDREYLARIVFRDPAALADLNGLVHPAVAEDFTAWAGRQPGNYVILESAILFESGFDAFVDRTVAVLAPEELRIARACRRDGCDADSVRRRIAAQADDDTLHRRADFSIVNISLDDLGPTVDELDRRFRLESNTSQHAD